MKFLGNATALVRRMLGTPAAEGVRHEALPGIPANRKALLHLSNEWPAEGAASPLSFTLTLTEDQNVEVSGPEEPSTIYAPLPVSWPAPSEESVAKLGYFPSYAGMSPDQRGVYLSWLQDVTRPIEVGYVFTYYYGLERHLVMGEFEPAVDEVLLLRKHHSNKSFQSYSGSALLHACLMRGRSDVLQLLYTDHELDYFGNSSLLLLHQQKLKLLPAMLLALGDQMAGVNRRYLKSERNLYRENLLQLLMDEFGEPSYAFCDRYAIEAVDGIPYAIFANVSLPPETRNPSLPSLMNHPPFVEEMTALFHRAHERTKAAKRRERGSASPA
ncbi:TerB N-terminal domain-containing protein [Achromobacter xylosoxidans]|nr:TerB N-terminal domain-containing protein [Achromobacter xylosoxidans]BEG74465.1 hypothetical protein HBIAX_01512 [Achromobacter xylosoxidans]